MLGQIMLFSFIFMFLLSDFMTPLLLIYMKCRRMLCFYTWSSCFVSVRAAVLLSLVSLSAGKKHTHNTLWPELLCIVGEGHRPNSAVLKRLL